MLLEDGDLGVYPLQVLPALLLVLALDELEAELARGEPGEQEREGRVLEEPLLSIFTVLVHRVSHQREVYVLVSASSRLKVVVVSTHYLLLVVAVRVHHSH